MLFIFLTVQTGLIRDVVEIQWYLLYQTVTVMIQMDIACFLKMSYKIFVSFISGKLYYANIDMNESWTH